MLKEYLIAIKRRITSNNKGQLFQIAMVNLAFSPIVEARIGNISTTPDFRIIL